MKWPWSGKSDLSHASDYDYREDCEYVQVYPSHQKTYESRGFKVVATQITQHDGQMLVMERRKV